MVTCILQQVPDHPLMQLLQPTAGPPHSSLLVPLGQEIGLQVLRSVPQVLLPRSLFPPNDLLVFAGPTLLTTNPASPQGPGFPPGGLRTRRSAALPDSTERTSQLAASSAMLLLLLFQAKLRCRTGPSPGCHNNSGAATIEESAAMPNTPAQKSPTL